VVQAITELKVGEALVSTLDAEGAPGMVARTLIAPPRSRLGPVSPAERAAIQAASPFGGKYDTAVNRESAAEVLAQKAADAAAAAQTVQEQGEAAQRAQPRQSPRCGAAQQGGNGRSGLFSRRDDRRRNRRQEIPRRPWPAASPPWSAPSPRAWAAKPWGFARGLLGGLLR
jgi:hypothetical protein